MENMSIVTVHPESVRSVLRSGGYHSRVPRKKPFISEINKAKHINDDESFWKTVVFSDESKFNLFGCDGKQKVWRKKNEQLQSKNLIPTVKHGGGSVMVWGCMSAAGVGNLAFIETTMDRFMYLNLLRDNLKDSVSKMGLSGSWVFQQDNDPKHTAAIVKEWLLYNVPKQLHSPPQSPDLNPIENLWVRKTTIKSKQDLKNALIREWSKISSETNSKLVYSMKRRLNAVLESKGGATKY